MCSNCIRPRPTARGAALFNLRSPSVGAVHLSHGPHSVSDGLQLFDPARDGSIGPKTQLRLLFEPSLGRAPASFESL